MIEIQIRCVNNISTMQFFAGISRNTQSKSSMLLLNECVRESQNHALWDTHKHALLNTPLPHLTKVSKILLVRVCFEIKIGLTLRNNPDIDITQAHMHSLQYFGR